RGNGGALPSSRTRRQVYAVCASLTAVRGGEGLGVGGGAPCDSCEVRTTPHPPALPTARKRSRGEGARPSSRHGQRTTEAPNPPPLDPRHPALRMLMRKNVLAGLMFIGVAALGLYVSRNYPVGTTLRMATGYVPRLLCWILMGLGVAIGLQGLRESDE